MHVHTYNIYTYMYIHTHHTYMHTYVYLYTCMHARLDSSQSNIDQEPSKLHICLDNESFCPI